MSSYFIVTLRYIFLSRSRFRTGGLPELGFDSMAELGPGMSSARAQSSAPTPKPVMSHEPVNS